MRKFETNAPDASMLKFNNRTGRGMGEKTTAEFVKNMAINDKLRAPAVHHERGNAPAASERLVSLR